MNWFTGRRMPRWLGAIVHSVGFPLVHGGAPYLLSLLVERHGWEAGWPGLGNLAGLVPVIAGFLFAFSCVREHLAAAPRGWLLEKTAHYPTPAYLITSGPYRYSRNPIYVAEAVIWLGWILFYGSLPMLGILVAAAIVLAPVILPREELGLQARFGEAYRDYQRTTPRWLGRPKR